MKLFPRIAEEFARAAEQWQWLIFLGIAYYFLAIFHNNSEGPATSTALVTLL